MDASRFVAVLGMHRSGTSAVTRALNLVGVALPGELMHNTQHNSSGHWEALEAVRIHDALFAAQHYTWDDPFIPADVCHAHAEATATARADIAAFITAYVHAHSTFAIKDPRLCHGLPLWLDELQSSSIQPCAIVMVRNPLEVAASLNTRDNMPIAIGLQLWMRYTLAAERHTRAIPRVVVHYDELIRDWQTALSPVFSMIGIDSPHRNSDIGKSLSAFLSRGEQHHRYDHTALIAQTAAMPEVATCYTPCVAGIDGAEAHTTFDQIRHTLSQLDAQIPAVYQQFMRYHTQQSIDEINTLKAELAWRIGIQQAQNEEINWRKSVMVGHKLEP